MSLSAVPAPERLRSLGQNDALPDKKRHNDGKKIDKTVKKENIPFNLPLLFNGKKNNTTKS